jgi:hypothetical protein
VARAEGGPARIAARRPRAGGASRAFLAAAAAARAGATAAGCVAGPGWSQREGLARAVWVARPSWPPVGAAGSGSAPSGEAKTCISIEDAGSTQPGSSDAGAGAGAGALRAARSWRVTCVCVYACV